MKRFLKLFHIHFFTKIVASYYRSFNYRDVICECRCGKRKLVEHIRHEEVYPFKTGMYRTRQAFLDELTPTEPTNEK